MRVQTTQPGGRRGGGFLCGVLLAVHLSAAVQAQTTSEEPSDSSPASEPAESKPAESKPAESKSPQPESAAEGTDAWAATRARLAERYTEARREYEAGHYELACPIFQEIFKLDPSPASLLDSGICVGEQSGWRNARARFERLVVWEETALGLLYLGFSRKDDGDPAGALAAYERATTLDMAAGTLDERSRQLMSSEVARLRAVVPQLSLVAEAGTAGAVVTMDDRPVELDGAPIRMNPGSHRLSVLADGMTPWSRDFVLQPALTLTIDIPALVPLPPTPVVPESVAVTPPAPSETAFPLEVSGSEHSFALSGSLPVAVNDRRRPLPWGLVGGGAALIGAGLVVGQLTLREERRLEECESDCNALSDGTRDLQRTTDALWVAGALVAGVGVGLLVFDGAGSKESERTSLSLGCNVFSCSLSAGGRF